MSEVFIPEEVFVPLLEESLKKNQHTVISVRGGSMLPFLSMNKKDTVTLKRPELPLKKGDIIFYRRSGGKHILHRIVKVRGEVFLVTGDAQKILETVRSSQVLAIVTEVKRRGKTVRPGSFIWWFYSSPWRLLRPIRCPLLQLAFQILKRVRKKAASS